MKIVVPLREEGGRKGGGRGEGGREGGDWGGSRVILVTAFVRASSGNYGDKRCRLSRQLVLRSGYRSKRKIKSDQR